MIFLFDATNGDPERIGTSSALEPSSAFGPHPKVSNEDSSRRSFFKMTMGGAVAGLVTAAGMEFAAPRRVLAQTPLSPDAALQELLDGNRRFSSERLTSCEHDLAILKQHTVDKQEPFAAVLSCADSRVPVELIFDQTIGHIFVTRVAGNFAASEIIASLEYGAAVLGTKVIVVLGHSGCGAVKATIQAKEVPGQISALFSYIRPAVDQAGPNLEAATKANAKIQAALLRQASTVISGLIKENKLKVVAGYYDLGTGVVSLLE
jgi:carbonic anhydrase